MVGIPGSLNMPCEKSKIVSTNEKAIMKTQHLVSLWALALLLMRSGTVLADPFMSSLQIGPQAPASVCPGSSASYTITITKTNTGPMDIFLYALGLPKGVTASFSPAQIDFGYYTTSATGSMTISTTGAMLPGPYSFRVWGDDGHSPNTMTNTATLEVTLCSPGIAPMSDGGMCFAFATQPGQTYLIQANTNFSPASWTTLCTTNAGTNNLLIFVDGDVGRYPCRFYRAVAQ